VAQEKKKIVGRKAQRNTVKGKPVEVRSNEELGSALKEGNDVILSSQLKSVYLSSEGLGAEESLRLINALKDSKVEVLNLSHNVVGDEGAKALSQSLNSSSIQELYLWSTKIGDEGAKALSEAIAKNNKLRTLQLRANNITASGGSSLAKALLSNKSLRLFDLWFNDIGSAFNDFSRVVAAHPSLEELHLTAPKVIPQKEASDWANAINSNKTLADLHIFNMDKKPFLSTIEKISQLLK